MKVDQKIPEPLDVEVNGFGDYAAIIAAVSLRQQRLASGLSSQIHEGRIKAGYLKERKHAIQVPSP